MYVQFYIVKYCKKMQTYHTAAPLAVHPDDDAAQNDRATDVTC